MEAEIGVIVGVAEAGKKICTLLVSLIEFCTIGGSFGGLSLSGAIAETKLFDLLRFFMGRLVVLLLLLLRVMVLYTG